MAQMTYLQLFQRAHQESGIAGAQPSAVTGQTGKLLKLVNWVSDAWMQIQLERDNWLFMHGFFTFQTIADQRDYVAGSVTPTAIDDLLLWDENSFLIYKTSLDTTDENFMEYETYRNWRQNNRQQMESRPADRPQKFTLLPSNAVRFEPKPDDAYTISGEYKRSAQLFTADADVPTNLPPDYQMIIVWQALKFYGFYEDAPDVLDQAETFYDNLLVRLEEKQLPEMSEDYQALA
jgi:hypothetical protein